MFFWFNKDTSGFAVQVTNRLGVLDGWRGLSILLVLAAHLLPLSKDNWAGNEAVGMLGMSLFFTLSGFLICKSLLEHDNVQNFLISRFFRILPLAWVCMAISLTLLRAPGTSSDLAHYFFYINFPPFPMQSNTAHFWSLCVEVHFYLGVAVLYAVFGKNALWLLPGLCLIITGLRIYTGTHVSIVTYLRLDEILAGCSLALLYLQPRASALKKAIGALNPWALAALTLAASFDLQGGLLNYARPYLAMFLIGSTLFGNGRRVIQWLNSDTLAFIASISFALYVIHPLLVDTWLGSGYGWEKYAKRPLLLMATFLLAYASTVYFEKPMMALGRRLARRGQPITNNFGKLPRPTKYNCSAPTAEVGIPVERDQ